MGHSDDLGGGFVVGDFLEGGGVLIPEIPFVEVDFVSGKKGAEFLLKGNLAMMFGLIGNVNFHRINV